MSEEATEDPARRLEESLKLRRLVFLSMLAPLVVIAMLGMSYLEQGRWIAGALGLICALTYGLAMMLRDPQHYRPSHHAGLLVMVCGMTAVAFLFLPVSTLPLLESMTWALTAGMFAVFGIGLGLGAYRLDVAALQKSARRRYRTAPGVMTIFEKRYAVFGLGLRKDAGTFDRLIHKIGVGYAFIVFFALIALGNTGSIKILHLLENTLPKSADLDLHAIAMMGMGVVALPFIGFVLPSFWQIWKDLRLREKEALGQDGKLILIWSSKR